MPRGTPQNLWAIELADGDIADTAPPVAGWTKYLTNLISITPGGGERVSGSVNVANENNSAVGVGGVGAFTYSVRGLYSGAAGSFYTALRARKADGQPFWMRLIHYIDFTATNPCTNVGLCYMTNAPLPSLDAGSGEPQTFTADIIAEGEVAGTVDTSTGYTV